jgi:hypothetical protein
VRTYNDELVWEYRVPTEGPYDAVVKPCGDLASRVPLLYPEGKEKEFESLVHDPDAPCVGHSRDWSCVRRLPYEDWLARGTEGYGFLESETTPGRVGLQTDAGYVRQIAMVPKVGSFGPGYVKMTMPKAMREALLPWYAEMKRNKEVHEPIPGG